MKRFETGHLYIIADWPFEVVERDGDRMVIQDLADGSRLRVDIRQDDEGEYVEDEDGGRSYPHE